MFVELKGADLFLLDENRVVLPENEALLGDRFIYVMATFSLEKSADPSFAPAHFLLKAAVKTRLRPIVRQKLMDIYYNQKLSDDEVSFVFNVICRLAAASFVSGVDWVRINALIDEAHAAVNRQETFLFLLERVYGMTPQVDVINTLKKRVVALYDEQASLSRLVPEAAQDIAASGWKSAWETSGRVIERAYVARNALFHHIDLIEEFWTKWDSYREHLARDLQLITPRPSA